VAVTEGNYIAYQKQGDALRDVGYLDEAAASLTQAIAAAPPGSPLFLALVYNDLGLV
jgi:hypothetical protein